MSQRRAAPLAAAALLTGAALVVVAGLRHPLLGGGGPGQLAIVAATAGWRAIHLALIAGEVLLVAGVIGLALSQADTGGAGATRGGALLFALGIGLALIQILFMGGAATALATAYVRAEPGLAATQAAFTYDMLHPFAQLAGRAGEFTVGLGVAVLGWGVAAGRRLPRWLGAAGVAAGCGCAAWAVVTPEHASMLMAGMGLVAAWAVACGGVLFARPHD